MVLSNFSLSANKKLETNVTEVSCFILFPVACSDKPTGMSASIAFSCFVIVVFFVLHSSRERKLSDKLLPA